MALGVTLQLGVDMGERHSVAESDRLDIDGWMPVHTLVGHLGGEAENWRRNGGTQMRWSTIYVPLRRLEARFKVGVIA